MQTGNKQIARFVQDEIRPHLARDFVPYKTRDLVRMQGPFLQLLALSYSRGGALRVHPTFFVVGADLSLPVIPQNTSLEVLDPAKWSFPDPTLNADFAERLVRQLEKMTPLSFTALLPLADDTAIPRLFQMFDKKTMHWSQNLYLAHYLLTYGRAQASEALRRTRTAFDKMGNKINGDPPPWRAVLDDRILELERRLTATDGQTLCRTDSDHQAAEFGLPNIIWP